MARAMDIHEGMIIYSADGEKLGKVVRCDSESFIIEKGLFFKKDYLARYDEVTAVGEDEAKIARYKADLQSLDERADEHAAERRVEGEREEARIPLKEEEVVVGKETRETGRVRVKKEVITEEKQVTVPVTREEVRVERVPASQSTPTDERFAEEEVTIPVREEKVVVGKRPVVREEVRVSKAPIQEEHTETETVRRERADIEREGDVRRAPGDKDKEYK